MRKKNDIEKKKFSERYPKFSAFVGLFMIALIAYGAVEIIHDAITAIGKTMLWLAETVSELDVVVIVALISGTVSIIGVVLSSFFAKMLDYRRTRREYLTKKREEPYSAFIEMIYKLQQSSKPGNEYPHNEMVEDLMRFSKQITLWGSPTVVNNWVKFKENALKGNRGFDNLLLTETIMNDMRKDLGLPKVKKGNLLAFFVNDIKETLEKAKKTKK